MTGFELQISGVGSDRSTNWATTTTQPFCYFGPARQCDQILEQKILIFPKVAQTVFA